MEALLYINLGGLVVLIGFVGRLAYAAGLLAQRVQDLSAEVGRMRDRLDRFLDPAKGGFGNSFREHSDG